MSTRADLESLLCTDPSGVVDFERNGFDSVAAPYEDAIVLFGAGGLGRRTLAGLRALGIEPLAFADNAQPLQGTEVEGVPVLAPAEAVARHSDRATFVTTIWGAVPRTQSAGRLQRDQRAQLEGLGCRRIVSFTTLYCKYPETFLPYFAMDLPHKVLEHRDAIRQAFDLMGDEISRREFIAQVKQRISHDFDALSPAIEEEQYFCDSLFGPTPGEVFVDCGAFDGDTLKEFLARWARRLAGYRYVALEPDPINFAKLTAYVASLPAEVATRVEARQVATGARRAGADRPDGPGLLPGRSGSCRGRLCSARRAGRRACPDDDQDGR